ncbi:tRNA-uridine aminocarboxypropyltransferase [Endozoicomonadaceae bacterium StTr2]
MTFCLLTHQTEFSKPTNTGQLVKELLPDTLILEWSRVELPEQLLDRLADPAVTPWLVFPGEYAIYHSAELFKAEPKAKSDQPLFIVLDATWQQARKIYRQSPYLHNLPLYNLGEVPESVYTLRRNQQAGHLCTAEVVACVLGKESQLDQQIRLERSLVQFIEDQRMR